MSLPAFTVDDVFVIEGRGPVLTSSKGVPLGTFSPGDRIQCGHRVARIMGVEAFGDRQRGLLVDADPAELWAGQVWIGYPPDTEPLTIDRETWMHGWPLQGTTFVLGTAVHCAGCGRMHGLATVAIDDEYIEFMKTHPPPDWPFNEETCAVCLAIKQEDEWSVEPPPWPRGKPRPLP